MAFGLVTLWPYTKQVNREAFYRSVSIQEARLDLVDCQWNLILVILYTISATVVTISSDYLGESIIIDHSYPSIIKMRFRVCRRG